MKVTPKFYTRKTPELIDGELWVLNPGTEPTTVRLFVKHDTSSGGPRTRVDLSIQETQRVIDQLQLALHCAKKAMASA